MIAYVLFSLILIVGLAIQSYKLHQVNARCIKLLKSTLFERDLTYTTIRNHLYDYLETMDNTCDVIGEHTDEELKLIYAKDFCNSARNMLTCIRMHEGGRNE